MAHFSQEMKKNIAPKVRNILRKYGMKGTLSIRNHSEVILTLRRGKIDFDLGDQTHHNVNVYHIDGHYEGVARDFLNEVYSILMEDNHNNSDIQTDYFDVGWYVSIHIGRWDQPYTIDE